MRASGIHDKTKTDLAAAKATTTEKTDVVKNTPAEEVEKSNAVNQAVIDTVAIKNRANANYADAQQDTARKILAEKTAKKTLELKAAIKPTYTKTHCDPVKGVISKVYLQADGCDETPSHEKETKWGDCFKDESTGYFVKITGASALKAASVAMVAFIGSQF